MDIGSIIPANSVTNRRLIELLRRWPNPDPGGKWIQGEMANPRYPDDQEYCDMVLALAADEPVVMRKPNPHVPHAVCQECQSVRYVSGDRAEYRYRLKAFPVHTVRPCSRCYGGRAIADRIARDNA